MKLRKNIFIHKSSYIDETANIGTGSKVWHFVTIQSNAKVGKNCIIGQNVMIGLGVKIGDNCKIQNNVSLYKGVTLEKNVFCGPSCVFTNVKTPRAFIDRSNEFSQTLIKKGCSIGANATIICGIELGEYSMIGAGALVTKNVRPYSLVIGSPAKHIGWVSESGERLGPDLICKRTGEIYEKKNGNLYKK